MRNRSPRSFTVETKSGGRRQCTVIPRRAEAPATPRQAVPWPVSVEPRAPAAEARRILPSLIVLETPPYELQTPPAETERSPQVRRGRPRKAKPVVAELAGEPIPAPAIVLAPAEPTLAPRTPTEPAMRASKSSPDLQRGERWKRRLGRWAR